MNLIEYAEIKRRKAEEKEAPEPLPNCEQTAEYMPRIRQQEQAKEDTERARQVYAKYQENIKVSSQTQTEILKGLQSGEDITTLFLKSCKVIGLMTSNTLFYEQAKEDIKAIYGIGLKQPQALNIELAEIQQRLKMLKRPELQNEPTESRTRIDRAIKAHEERATELSEMIKGA